MTPLKSVLLASSASVLVLSAFGAASPAHAQTPPIYNWTGFYIGGNAGAAWGRSDATSSVVCDRGFFTTDPSSYICGTTSSLDSRAVAASGTGSLSKSGFTGGVQAGYNWQAGNFLYGTELDFGAFNLKASRSVSGTYPGGGFAPPFGTPYTIGSAVETDWLFTARGRIGWAFSSLLIYGTGGLAVTDLKVTNSFRDSSFAAASASGSGSQTKAGWVLGGGAEWALGNNWTVKGEFLYLISARSPPRLKLQVSAAAQPTRRGSIRLPI